MTDIIPDLLEEGLERYKSGESAETLIPLFREQCDRHPKDGTAWSCLAWLYMLTDQPAKALKAAQKAVKLAPGLPQARINLAATMLQNNQKGVREQIEIVQQMIKAEPELLEQLDENIIEGLTRKPDWKELEKIKKWLFS